VAKAATEFLPISFKRGLIMLLWAAVFFVIAIIAGLLGFTGIAAGAADIAKICFYSFLILFVVFLILGGWRRRVKSTKKPSF
jgi:uncharacterized membrane protein YtjA (UPF0391 family)